MTSATPLRVLVGCETSGVVRRAFAALGHDAWSCDLLPSEDGPPRVVMLAVLDMLAAQEGGAAIECAQSAKKLGLRRLKKLFREEGVKMGVTWNAQQVRDYCKACRLVEENPLMYPQFRCDV